MSARGRWWLRGIAVLGALLVACGGAASPEGPEHDEEEHEEGPPDEVHLSEAAIAANEIEIGRIERRALSGSAGFPAELSFDPLSTAHVSPLAAGRFTRVEVALGDRVEAGQLLGSVVSGSASEARSQLDRARARLAAAEAALERQRQLVGERIGARRALVEAEAEVAGLRAESRGLARQLGVLGTGRGGQLRLVAPIAGVVVEVHATPGETASSEEPAFVIADPSGISVYGRIPELAIGRVRQGQATIFRPHAFGELALAGTLQYLAPAIDPHTRSLTVRVALESLDPRLRSGMYGSLELVEGEGRSLAVPTSAVVAIAGRPTVFVPGEAQGAFRAVSVRIGQRAGAYYRLLGGLEEEASVVTAGAFALKSMLLSDEIAEDHD